jgi:DNA-binding MarR family transcriptional regulator
MHSKPSAVKAKAPISVLKLVRPLKYCEILLWGMIMLFSLLVCMLTIILKNPSWTIHEIPKQTSPLFMTSSLLPAIDQLAQLYARPGFLLRRAHQISAAVFEDECRSVGLTPAQFGVMSVLQARPGLDQSSLARALGFDKVTVLRVLRGLEARGLIVRTPIAIRRRSLAISLSDAGRDLLSEAQEPVERAYWRLMAPLNDTQKVQLVALLQTLTKGLESDARAAFVPHERAASKP